METEVISLRGHHIRYLKNYLINQISDLIKLTIPENIIKRYGKEFNDNREKMFVNIYRGKSLVKIIAKYDFLCNKCPFKIKGGCIPKGIFHNEKETGAGDIREINQFKLELNRIYSGEELAEILL